MRAIDRQEPESRVIGCDSTISHVCFGKASRQFDPKNGVLTMPYLPPYNTFCKLAQTENPLAHSGSFITHGLRPSSLPLFSSIHLPSSSSINISVNFTHHYRATPGRDPHSLRWPPAPYPVDYSSQNRKQMQRTGTILTYRSRPVSLSTAYMPSMRSAFTCLPFSAAASRERPVY